MSDPISLLQAAGTTLKVISSVVSGNTADKIGTRNANILNDQAAMTLRAAGTREEMLRERNRQSLSSQRAAMLANGVDPTSGSALIGSAQQMRDAELDALTVRYEGILQARGLHQQADMALWEGKMAKKQSRFDAVSSLIGGAGNYLKSSGFGQFGPGFSGQQAPAPVSTARPTPNPYYGGG